MLEVRPDGSVITYLTTAYTPAAKADATLARVLAPDGTVHLFYRPPTEGTKGYPEYNPDQPRDGEGRWSAGGGAGGRVGQQQSVDDAQNPPITNNLMHPYHTEAAMRAAVPAAQTAFEELVNRDGELQHNLHARSVLPATLQEFMQALDDQGNVVIVAQPKSPARSTEKVAAKYAGDWGRLTDAVRGTIAVDTVAEVRAAAQAVVQETTQHPGWALAAPVEDRIAHPPDDTGYRDMVLKLKAPNNLVVELQINTKAMIKAKELEGHKLYEEARTIREQAQLHGWTQAARDRFRQLEMQAHAVYAEAWRQSQG